MVVLEQWLVCGSRDALGDQTLLLAKQRVTPPLENKSLDLFTP
jgi:hypothetical protein